MKLTLLAVMTLCLTAKSNGQSRSPNINAKADSIQTEAMRLFRSEFASWYGTDIFMDKLKHKQPQIGGYVSYADDKVAKNVFFGKGEDPDVLSTISFDATFNGQNYKTDTIARKLTANERELYSLRLAAAAIMPQDTLFRHYNNTSFNLVPIAYQGHKRVYVLTAPKANGAIILGNDYLLEFDDNYKLLSRRKLHNNILPFNTKRGDGQVASVHNHQPETGDLITATDICTLMLYKNATDWATHYVFSNNYVSIWDVKKNGMAVMTREAWDKMNSDKAKKDSTVKK